MKGIAAHGDGNCMQRHLFAGGLPSGAHCGMRCLLVCYLCCWCWRVLTPCWTGAWRYSAAKRDAAAACRY